MILFISLIWKIMNLTLISMIFIIFTFRPPPQTPMVMEIKLELKRHREWHFSSNQYRKQWICHYYRYVLLFFYIFFIWSECWVATVESMYRDAILIAEKFSQAWMRPRSIDLDRVFSLRSAYFQESKQKIKTFKLPKRKKGSIPRVASR